MLCAGQKLRRVLNLFVLGCCGLLAAVAHGAITTLPNIPDFYQHQYWEKLPTGVVGNEATGGYCRPIAIVDALYPWKVQPAYAGLFNKNIATNGAWGPAARDAVDAVINPGMFDINKYVESKGFEPAKILEGKPSLLATTYTVDETNGQVSVILAGGATEVVKNGANNVKAFDLYVDQSKRGRSSVATVIVPGTAPINDLWWWDSFHALGGAGYDEAASLMQLTDPDSNKGNQKANGGWYNLNPNGTWNKSIAGINAAKTKVTNNMYTAADLAAGVPLPGNNNGAAVAYTNSDLYAQLKVAADGFKIIASDDTQSAVPGVYATGQYTGTQLAQLETIAPTLGALEPLINLGVNKFRSTIKLLGDLSSSINEIKIFPTANVDLADPNFFFDQPGWSELPTLLDPYGYARSGGGLDLLADPGTYFSPGSSGFAMFDTTSTYSGFDMFFHDYLTDTWLVQSIGAPGSGLELQTQIPEPGTLVGAAWIVGVALLGRRRRMA